MKIVKEGLLFILPSLAVAVLFFIYSLWLPFAIFLITACCFCFFFRDPKREIPQNKNLLLSPADGKIVKITTVEFPPFLPSSVTIVSVFLSLFNVHITRAPISGTVREVEYKPGKFFSAYKDKASIQNESNSILINGDETNILVKQIAGFAARRIKCFVKKNEIITRGQKIGLIYFGSRVDIFIPKGIQLKVNLNQKVKGGCTEIGEKKHGK